MKIFKMLWCFFIGHTQTNICKRCGKPVWQKNKPKVSLQDRINTWWQNTKSYYVGSIRLKKGRKLYALNILTGELKEVDYRVVDGKKQAEHSPEFQYIYASNLKNAQRKADKILSIIRT